ncbi:MAG: M56 family metallopeptidase [Bacteroidales bacterium]|nr:M56 family metallopeptidase [Bacteroidales bacterium]MCF8403232.1 M56 family metallopeptidase [Bacteroidales bacterium]
MNNLIIYLLQSGFCLGILYAIYWLLLSKDTFFTVHRIYLVLSVLVSLLFPLLEISIITEKEQTLLILLEPVVITTDRITETLVRSLTFSQLFLIIYFAGVAFLSIRFFIRLFQIGQLIYSNRIVRKYGLNVITLSSKYTPFSFFNLLFISESNLSKDQIEKIIAHERIHIQQKHSTDVVLLEIASILQWFNPFIWLYSKSLKSVHEYQADEGVLNSGCHKSDYQRLLLNQTFGVQLNTLSNNLNHSLIKKRFLMMTKSRTKKSALLKMLLVIPLAIVFALVFSITITESVVAQAENASEKVTKIKKPQKEGDVFTVVEKMPRFPGGEEARIKFMTSNIKYPEDARKLGETGTVFITFIVEKDGSISEAKVLRGFYKSCDEEALRVINAMPRWEPGMDKGKPVRTQFNMPISFVLDKKGEKVVDKDTRDADSPPPPRKK